MPGRQRLTRRTFALSGVAAGSASLLAACDDALPDRAPVAPQYADGDLLRTVLRAELGALSLSRQAAARYRSLRPPLRLTTRFHADHVRLLRAGMGSRADPTPPRPRVPASPAAALAAVVASERRLVRAHDRSAMAARGGEVARLIAGMSASAAQQAHLLSAVRARDLR